MAGLQGLRERAGVVDVRGVQRRLDRSIGQRLARVSVQHPAPSVVPDEGQRHAARGRAQIIAR